LEKTTEMVDESIKNIESGIQAVEAAARQPKQIVF
jgi:hypothetical protein